MEPEHIPGDVEHADPRPRAIYDALKLARFLTMDTKVPTDILMHLTENVLRSVERVACGDK
jgi:hypothetical protein